ncbi:WecB/TagA/CpsF family glycosyltransferase [Vibrio sp. JZG10]
MTQAISVLGYQVTSKKVEHVVTDALSTSGLSKVNTINPHSYVESKKDIDFKSALISSDELIPDGSGIVLAAKLLHGSDIKKIAGADLFLETMRNLENRSGKVFFLGSTERVLERINEKISTEFPSVKVETLSPPYKSDFTNEDKQAFVQAINAFSPDVIFVGLTAPKQEKLIESISSEVSAKMISGIGAVFDFYAGTVKRPRQLWLDLHLEWLVRLLGEPRRLWRRTFVSMPIFLFDLVVEKLKGSR